MTVASRLFCELQFNTGVGASTSLSPQQGELRSKTNPGENEADDVM